MMYVISGDRDYYITQEPLIGGYAIDVTQKFIERYNAYEAEREFIQSKLHRYHEDARRARQLKECQEKDIQSKGFK